MSLPEFTTGASPSREEAINQIIASIAMEELGISHIINAEGEKLQYVLGTIPGVTGPSATIEDVLKVNESVRAVLQHATESQSLLKNKLQNALASAVLTGPKGETGEQGPVGAATIDVATATSRLEPGALPTVINTGNNVNAVLEFGIPRGETGAIGATGATGATGAANGLNAFGGIYNNAEVTGNLLAATPYEINLPTTLGSRKVAYTTPNNIIVEEAGLYDITYSMNPGFNAAATLILAVRSNEVPIQSAVATIVETGTDPYSINFAGNTIATLATGAIVDMSVTSNVAQTINFEANSLEYLNVLKLD